MSGLKTKASYRFFWQSYISLRGRRPQGCHGWREGGKMSTVGEDPRKEVGKKSERKREKMSLFSPPCPPPSPPTPFDACKVDWTKGSTFGREEKESVSLFHFDVFSLPLCFWSNSS